MTNRPKFDTKLNISFQDNAVHKIAENLMKERNEIVDLFCKTFLIVQEPPSLEALKDLFTLIELECTVNKGVSQTFRIKLRETTTPNKG